MADYNSAYTGAQIDAAIGAVAGKLDKAGGTMTGELEIQNGGIYFSDNASLFFGTLENGVNIMHEGTADNLKMAFYGRYGDEAVVLHNIALPSVDIDAANKGYVDGAIAAAIGAAIGGGY